MSVPIRTKILRNAAEYHRGSPIYTSYGQLGSRLRKDNVPNIYDTPKGHQ